MYLKNISSPWFSRVNKWNFNLVTLKNSNFIRTSSTKDCVFSLLQHKSKHVVHSCFRPMSLILKLHFIFSWYFFEIMYTTYTHIIFCFHFQMMETQNSISFAASLSLDVYLKWKCVEQQNEQKPKKKKRKELRGSNNNENMNR